NGGGICCGDRCGCDDGSCCDLLSGACAENTKNDLCGGPTEICFGCPDTEARVEGESVSCGDVWDSAPGYCADGLCCPAGQVSDGGVCVAACGPTNPVLCGKTCVAEPCEPNCSVDGDCAGGQHCAGDVCCPLGLLNDGGACVTTCGEDRPLAS